MKMIFKLLMCCVVFFLSACGSNNPSGYEKVIAVVTAANGNLYVLTDRLDYEFPKSRIKDTKLFFELAPAFLEVGQPISARMWVKERSVDFSFDDAILRIYQQDNYKFSYNQSLKAKEDYSKNNNAKQLLKSLEKMVKQDRSGKLALKYENNGGGVIDYSLRTNSKIKHDKIRGKIVEITNREAIIQEYQSVPSNLNEYRINIFYEPSIVKEGVFGKRIEKETLLSGESITLTGWKSIIPLHIK